MATEWQPDFCIAPADTLQEWLSENGLTIPIAAVAAAGRAQRDQAAAMITEVMERRPLTEAHALVLERATHIAARMWLALEHNYRAGLAAGRHDASEVPGEDGTGVSNEHEGGT